MAARKTTTSAIMNSLNYKSWIGKRVKIRIYSGIAGLEVGSIVVIKSITSPGTTNAYFTFEGGINGGSPLCLNYTTFEATIETREDLAAYKEDIQKRKKELDREIEQVDHKLHYLAETGETEVDEKTYRMYHIMKTMEKDMEPLEKAKLLAKVLD